MTAHAARLAAPSTAAALGLIAALAPLPATAAPAPTDAPAPAPAVRPDFRPDGSVQVNGRAFPTAAAYYASSEFDVKSRRCASHAAPSRAALIAPSDCSLTRTVINPDYSDNTELVIQTVFHIVKRSDGTGAVSRQQVLDQIKVLNQDFLALPGTLGGAGTNTRIRFVLARFDPDGEPTDGIEVVTNDAWYADPGPDAPNAMKAALNWDPERYLNVYTNDAAGNLGYATFPADNAGLYDDGIVLHHQNIGLNVPNAAPFDLGRTATHEIGHYLGLYHTFQGACGTASSPYTTGDLISDTPREAEPASGCTPSVSACGGGLLNPIENYMDYSDDNCMTKFTFEQANRIRCSLINYRYINTAPAAVFASEVNGASVTFTNDSDDAESLAAELTYRWDFGDGTTSDDRSPTHRYTASGTYDVTLEVTDPDSAPTTATQQVKVTVTGGPDDNGPKNPAGGISGGCSAGGAGAGGGALLSLAGAALALGLRRRRARAV